ncbi:MAG: hypothetical protein QM754_10755 [Tepidisphaeraceae bacterium]
MPITWDEHTLRMLLHLENLSEVGWLKHDRVCVSDADGKALDELVRSGLAMARLNVSVGKRGFKPIFEDDDDENSYQGLTGHCEVEELQRFRVTGDWEPYLEVNTYDLTCDAEKRGLRVWRSGYLEFRLTRLGGLYRDVILTEHRRTSDPAYERAEDEPDGPFAIELAHEYPRHSRVGILGPYGSCLLPIDESFVDTIRTALERAQWNSQGNPDSAGYAFPDSGKASYSVGEGFAANLFAMPEIGVYRKVTGPETIIDAYRPLPDHLRDGILGDEDEEDDGPNDRILVTDTTPVQPALPLQEIMGGDSVALIQEGGVNELRVGARSFRLSDAQYSVLQVLYDAHENSLTEPELNKKCGNNSGAARTLRTLLSEVPEIGKILKTPEGKRGAGFKLLRTFPTSPLSENSD